MNIQRYYEQIVGSKILEFGFTEEDGEKFPTFFLEHPEHGCLKIEVSRDPEGNGSGFLFISEDNTTVLPMSNERTGG